MEESRKKQIQIGVIIVCLSLAGVMICRSCLRRSGIPDHFAEEMTWVRCRNSQCEAEYQITKMDYFRWVEKYNDPREPAAPPLICKECGEKSVRIATKCEKCELVFERGTIPGDFEDRCPVCGYSKEEELRKLPE